jgi:hypothetical protein
MARQLGQGLLDRRIRARLQVPRVRRGCGERRRRCAALRCAEPARWPSPGTAPSAPGDQGRPSVEGVVPGAGTRRALVRLATHEVAVRTPAVTARHPSRNTASTTLATRTNAGAVPCPVAARSSMPRATAATQTGMPCRGVSGQRPDHQRTSAHPTAAPARNGQAVRTAPTTGLASWWLVLPTAAKTTIRAASATAACHAFRTAASAGAGRGSGRRPRTARRRTCPGESGRSPRRTARPRSGSAALASPAAGARCRS